ncbi:MAG: hypothetical protein KI792_09545 [Alphaproteobacteria bacterium]|nr:hypothetical protein [Alphaproteobacteria bacterium SS10]
MSKNSSYGLNKAELFVLAIVLIALLASLFMTMTHAQNLLNAFIPFSGLPILYALGLIGSGPIAYYFVKKCLRVAEDLSDLKEKVQDAPDDRRAEKMNDEIKRLNGVLLGVVAGGLLLSYLGAASMLLLNKAGASLQAEEVGLVTSAFIRTESSSTSGSATSTQYCLVAVEFANGDAISLREDTRRCQRLGEGDELPFTRYRGLFGLAYYSQVSG